MGGFKKPQFLLTLVIYLCWTWRPGIESVVFESAYHVIGLKTPSLWVTLNSFPGLHSDWVQNFFCWYSVIDLCWYKWVGRKRSKMCRHNIGMVQNSLWRRRWNLWRQKRFQEKDISKKLRKEWITTGIRTSWSMYFSSYYFTETNFMLFISLTLISMSYESKKNAHL